VLAGPAARASLWNRRRKLALFLETMRPGPETRVVDVGVGDTPFGTEPGVAATHNFFEALYPWPERITAVSDVPLPHFAEAFPAIRTVVADGLALPFADDEFDVAFSNAVVEHVGGREQQRRFVAELCRVAPRVFVSTPNRWFPVETHTLVPFVHWLPRPAADRAMRALRRERWERVDLLTRAELLGLFPTDVAARAVESRITISVVAERR
jgi:SAM-dependent methyltransferase